MTTQKDNKTDDKRKLKMMRALRLKLKLKNVAATQDMELQPSRKKENVAATMNNPSNYSKNGEDETREALHFTKQDKTHTTSNHDEDKTKTTTSTKTT